MPPVIGEGPVIRNRFGVLAAALGAAMALSVVPASAESMAGALASAYTDNPDLNSARAQLRAIDEGVPKALSGYRPTASATIDIGTQTTRQQLAGLPMSDWSTGVMPRSYTLSVEQPIFLGFRTANGVKLAQSSVKAAREQLKVVEASVLLDGVTAFMDVIRAQVVVNLTAQNIEFLREQLRAAEDRLNVGEGTRTDVAQTNARLQEGISDYAQAVADLNRAIATYIQIIGHRPESLGGYNGIERLLPKSMDAGLESALRDHPAIVAALYNIDIASYNVRIAEGAALPTLGVSASVSRREDQGIHDTSSEIAQISGRLTVPLYQGGEVAANVRQFKETLGQRRIDLDSARAQVRQAFVAAWGQLDAARAQVTAAEAQVAAQQLVLSGMIEERRVGQRTTLDVLDAQQDLLSARVSLVNAQYQRVVGAYTVLSAYGKLDARTLGLAVNVYDPAEHLNAVRDRWGGLRTPDGR
jgi:outer membrane protein